MPVVFLQREICFLFPSVICSESQVCAFLFREGSSSATISVRWFLIGNNSSSVVLIIDLDLSFLHIAERETVIHSGILNMIHGIS